MGHWESCETGCCSVWSAESGGGDVLVVLSGDGMYRWWQRDAESGLSVGDGGMGFMRRAGAERAAERGMGLA